ncbi:unnamed protein product [Meganyctiphanes norvegica]|uniref:Ig-like domain-containing protein n=1 Tax=Meganyctiphanes norvegica TaxID=48144 RepID=A0AAV2RHH0_MEGNR
MDVIAVPSGPPLVQSSRRPAMYSPGEILRLNCTSPGAKHVTLVWYINGEKIKPQPPTLLVVHRHGSNSTPDTQTKIRYSGRSPDLLSVLQMQLKFSHFKDGPIHIICVAVLHKVYNRSTELHIRQFEVTRLWHHRSSSCMVPHHHHQEAPSLLRSYSSYFIYLFTKGILYLSPVLHLKS